MSIDEHVFIFVSTFQNLLYFSSSFILVANIIYLYELHCASEIVM